MDGMLDDPGRHCLFFSLIIRVIFDWGKGLTSVFAVLPDSIPELCPSVVSLGVKKKKSITGATIH